MRNITKMAVEAFMAGKYFTRDNTTVNIGKHDTAYVTMRLYDSVIAKRVGPVILITNAGYFTRTTKERLNGIPGVSIQQNKGLWYLNGKEWDGSEVQV